MLVDVDVLPEVVDVLVDVDVLLEVVDVLVGCGCAAGGC